MSVSMVNFFISTFAMCKKEISLFWQSSQKGKCFVASKTIATILINNSSLLYTLSEF